MPYLPFLGASLQAILFQGKEQGLDGLETVLFLPFLQINIGKVQMTFLFLGLPSNQKGPY